MKLNKLFNNLLFINENIGNINHKSNWNPVLYKLINNIYTYKLK